VRLAVLSASHQPHIVREGFRRTSGARCRYFLWRGAEPHVLVAASAHFVQPAHCKRTLIHSSSPSESTICILAHTLKKEPLDPKVAYLSAALFFSCGYICTHVAARHMSVTEQQYYSAHPICPQERMANPVNQNSQHACGGHQLLSTRHCHELSWACLPTSTTISQRLPSTNASSGSEI
jgi:hypothetical protein